MKKKNREKRSISVVLLLGVIAFAGIITISQIKLHNEIKHLTDVSKEYSKQIAEYNEENSNLHYILEGENASEYIEQYAREELDYIKPNERVYADSDS